MKKTPILAVKQMPPAYQIVNAPERERPTLLGVLRHKFLLWLQDASWRRVFRALTRLCAAIGVVVGVGAPQFLLGALASSLTFHDALVLKAGVLLLALFYGRAWYRLARRLQGRIRNRGNQHTFEGMPIDELAGYLLSSGRFTRDDAMSRLGLSQPRHKKVADILEECGVLYRGEFNALQLRPIGREQLVSILRSLAAKKGSPLVFDTERGEWFERDGMANRWILDRERKERQSIDARIRAEKRIEKKEEKLNSMLDESASSPFVRRLIMADAAV